MTTYAIGDIHGCRQTLDRLLEAIDFEPTADRLWLTGDLVNRGPDSLGVLRWARDLGDRATTVLGNHDLHLLGVAAGAHRLTSDDTLRPVLDAPDAGELLDWLCRRPLMHATRDHILVHAGLLPQWDRRTATDCAEEIESALSDDSARDFLETMYGDRPRAWRADLSGEARRRLIVNAMTRMRTLTPSGELDLEHKGTLEDLPDDRYPWFAHPQRPTLDATVLFGHWSALGFHRAEGAIGLDSGCVWGNTLTALNLQTGEVTQAPSQMPDVL